MNKLNYLAASVVVFSALCGSVNAQAINQDVAIDERKNTVTNDFGNCVRTKWDSDGDVCAPEAAPAPAPVAAPIPAPVVISREARTVYFEFDKANLTPESVAKLDSLIAHIATSKDITGSGIAGYADSFGSSDYNMSLSKRRAKAVYDYLSKRVKINTQLLDIRALGNSATTTTCAAEKNRVAKIACMATDRRVEVEFEYKK